MALAVDLNERLRAGAKTALACKTVIDNPLKGRPGYDRDYIVTPFGGEPVMVRGCCDGGEAKRYYYVHEGIKNPLELAVSVARYEPEPQRDVTRRPNNKAD